MIICSYVHDYMFEDRILSVMTVYFTFDLIFEHFEKDQGKNGMSTTPRNVKARSGAAGGYNQVRLFISTCTFMLYLVDMIKIKNSNQDSA